MREPLIGGERGDNKMSVTGGGLQKWLLKPNHSGLVLLCAAVLWVHAVDLLEFAVETQEVAVGLEDTSNRM